MDGILAHQEKPCFMAFIISAHLFVRSFAPLYHPDILVNPDTYLHSFKVPAPESCFHFRKLFQLQKILRRGKVCSSVQLIYDTPHKLFLSASIASRFYISLFSAEVIWVKKILNHTFQINFESWT